MNGLRQCHDRQEWDDYVLEHGGHPLQLWGWGNVKASHNWKARRLFMADESGKITAATQVLIRKLPWPFRSLAYVPRGPILDGAKKGEFLGDLSDYVRHHYHSVTLTIEPDSTDFVFPVGWIKSENRILPAKTVILDLRKSEAELMAAMAKKTRQYIRKSSGDGVVIKRIKDRQGLEECLVIYRETAGRAGFNLHDDKYYVDVFEEMRDNSMIFAAYFEDKIVAFLWLAISADTAFELYGGVNEIGQQIRANYALKWQAIQKCKEWGIARYDFGGLIDGGVSTFKMGWDDHETDLVGTFDLPLSVFYFFWNSWLPLAKKAIRRTKAVLKRS